MSDEFPRPRQAVLAEYSDQIVPDYLGNPLIEALPPIFSDDELYDILTTYPEYHERERELPPEYRYHCVMRIARYFQPWTKHFDLENRLSRVIRQGYIARNPIGRNYAMLLQQGYQMIKNKKYDGVFNSEIFSSASGFTIIGISGIGKTKAIEHVLAPYPKIIVHSEYLGEPLNLYQIPWLKLDCPFDGSLKGLCLNFFMKVDELLGTNYYEKYGSGRNVSVNTMIPRMAQLASLHCIGVLIIDEIQHLSLQKSGGAEKMLNFFVNLVNIIGIPVVLVGTYKARPILQDAFRQARRGSGQQGDMTWDLLQNDEVWDLLIDGLMKYQWTKVIIPHSKEIKDVLYEESQGIVDIAIKLFMMAQLKAISSGVEEVTPEIIHFVAKENLQLVRPMLDALKSGKLSAIAKFDDIQPLNIHEFYDKNSPLAHWEVIKQRKTVEDKKRQEEQRTVREDAIVKLLELGTDEELALRETENVIHELGSNNISVNDIVKAVYRRIITLEDQPNVKVAKRQIQTKQSRIKTEKIPATEENVLRKVVENGRKNNLSAYESLKKAGYIQRLLRQSD